jgi:glycerophosphoryl diester phosphodiesterase
MSCPRGPARLPEVVWTVNREAEMEWFIKEKVDGMFTDYPDRLIRLLEGN